MARMRWTWVVLGLVGCGGGGGEDGGEEDPPAWPATCDGRQSTVPDQAGICRVWSGDQTAPVEDFEALCAGTYGGTFGAEAELPCPEDGVVGHCETDQGAGLWLTYTYYADTFDTDGARAHCESQASCDLSCEFVDP